MKTKEKKERKKKRKIDRTKTEIYTRRQIKT